MDKGAALNKRVWSLFEKAGFATEPSSYSTFEHRVQLAPGEFMKVGFFATNGESQARIGASNLGSSGDG